MDVRKPEPIKLTAEEELLLRKINFEPCNFGMPDTDPDGRAAEDLTRILLQRKAIPEVRRRYFTDPKLNIGGRGKSREQVFETNGTRGEAILRHGNFLKYLKYFIFGPNLPSEAMARLRQVVEDDLGSSGMILDQLRRVSRAEARRLPARERQNAAEEFFKLALEIGLDMGVAASVREAVLSVR